MREIKFRAWDKEEKCMAGPADNLYVDFNRGKCWIKNFEDYLIEEVDFVPMQFTGLKDKNGKEIYEGDILRDFKEENRLVQWNEKFARWKHGEYPNDVSFDPIVCGKVFEVIGNIYENPELA